MNRGKKRIKYPYGMADFYDIITSGYFFIDRTDLIPLIEDYGKQILFLRPRRFGKSLLLSMLENYYDAAKAEEWERLFGHLAVGKTPTPMRSRYLIMNWDFSAVRTEGTQAQILQGVDDHINGCIEHFISRYEHILDRPIQIKPDNAMRSFQSVLAAVQSCPYSLYLLIDEYDNFANEVLMGGRATSQERYENMLTGEGSLKSIFKSVKSAARGMGLDRVFITGVSPVVMSDITSGYNVAEDISLMPDFNSLCGFREEEIAGEIERLTAVCDLEAEKAGEVISLMRTFYNGYRFSYRAEEAIYNPTLALYFIKYFQRECRYPRQILDSNLAMDKGKIAYIAHLPHGERVILDALDEKSPIAISELADDFGIKQVLSTAKDVTFIVSLLYYFGIMTLTGQRTPWGGLIFKIPNLVIRKLYVQRLREMLLPEFQEKDDIQQIVRTFYQTGNLSPVCDFVENRYFTVFNNRDYRWANELTVKTAFLTLLFNDTFYIMDSEPALERRYADLIMIIRPDMRQYELLDFLIEFKFVELGKHGLSAEKVRKMSAETLAGLEAVKKKEEEAEKELAAYEKTLKRVYGKTLRLKTYTVVAVGFDRLVWKERAFE